jgi:hypothetical protein
MKPRFTRQIARPQISGSANLRAIDAAGDDYRRGTGINADMEPSPMAGAGSRFNSGQLIANMVAEENRCDFPRR